jgi:hypothetical protein
MAEHGTAKVDQITALIDEALSGYETQRAGDVWYPEPSDREDETRGEAWQRIIDAFIGLADALGPLLGAFHLDDDPDRLANDWTRRAYWTWDNDEHSDWP